MIAVGAARLAEVLGTAYAGPDLDVRGVTVHSGRIGQDAAFFALPGRRSHGHDHLREALDGGAVLAVTTAGRALPEGVDPARVLVVDDVLASLQRLAAWWRTQLRGPVVAVVGGNGKTTTKDALVHLAGGLGLVYGSPGSYNSQLGVPLALLRAPADADAYVVEAAASEPGDMECLADVVRPDHLLVTNLGTRWSANFPSTAARAASLTAMARGLTGWVLVGDDDPALGAALTGSRVVRPGDAGLPSFDRDGQAVFPDGRRVAVGPDVPSPEILRDVQLAVTAAALLGVDADALAAAGSGFRATSTRSEMWRSPRGVTLIREIETADGLALRSGLHRAVVAAGTADRVSLVLSEPAAPWSDQVVEDVAAALEAEQVGAVHAVAGPSAGRLAARLPGVRLHPDLATLRDELLTGTTAGDVVVCQAPRDSGLPDLSVMLLESMAATRLYIDLSALEENVAAFRRRVGPSVRLLGMVKALAYGTDSTAVATALQESGIDMLGVSNADEGLALRRSGVSVPILVMLPLDGDAPRLARHGLTPMVYSQEIVDSVLDSGIELEVHLEVDSGMHRTGLPPAAAVAALERLAAAPHVRVTGLMTHLACADDPAMDDFTDAQLAAFRTVVEAADSLGLDDLVVHASATAATMRRTDAFFGMVRLGIGLYGIAPSPACEKEMALEPVLGLRSRIVEVQDLAAGERVGYGATYTTPAGGGRIATVPAGYHDCVPRSFSNHGLVVVDGRRVPIVGRVSMDSMTLDVTGAPDARVGSDVLIWGTYGDVELSVSEVAERIGTIPYELMTSVGTRVQRIFTRH